MESVISVRHHRRSRQSEAIHGTLLSFALYLLTSGVVAHAKKATLEEPAWSGAVVNDQTRSTVQPLSQVHYRLSNFCIDLPHGQIVVFGPQAKGSTTLTITNEYRKRQEITIQHAVPNSPLMRRFNGTEWQAVEVGAILEVTGAAGWHLLHHLVRFSKLIDSEQLDGRFQAFLTRIMKWKPDLPRFAQGNFSTYPSGPLFYDAVFGHNWKFFDYGLVHQKKFGARPGDQFMCYKDGYIDAPVFLTGHARAFHNMITPKDFGRYVHRLQTFHGSKMASAMQCPPLVVMTERVRKRTIINWQEVQAVTRQELDGFEVRNVRWELMPLREQWVVSSSMVGIIGAHGANLVWVAYMVEGGVKVELCPYGCEMFRKSGINNDPLGNYGALVKMRNGHSVNWRNTNRSNHLNPDGKPCDKSWRFCDTKVNINEYRSLIRNHATKYLAPFLQRCNATAEGASFDGGGKPFPSSPN